MKSEPLVPGSWKLWALVLRSLAGAGGDSAARPAFDASFAYAAGSLYAETCGSCSRRLPVEVFALKEPEAVLAGMKAVVDDITGSYREALPSFERDHSVRPYFEAVNRNCQLISALLESPADLAQWHRIVDGVCFAHTAPAAFASVLDPSEWSPGGTAAYEGASLHPLPGYGMAVYAFFLLLMLRRDYEGWSAIMGDWGETAVEAYWAEHFQARIAWDSREYHIREEAWKDAYVLPETFTDIPRERLSEGEETLLGGLLCQRGIFDKVFSPEYFARIAGGDSHPEPVFAQYRYIHGLSVSGPAGTSSRDLDALYQLLVRETGYLYDNHEMIADGFMARDSALMQQNFSKWIYESRQADDRRVEEIYDGTVPSGASEVLEIFLRRRDSSRAYLWEQPVIHSELVYAYLTDCIVQNERLKTEIRRAIGESDLLKAFAGKAAERMKKEQNRQDRKDNAIRSLLERGVIDDQCNIQLKNPNGKGKQFRSIELTNFLVGNYYAKPPRGWVNYIETFKNRNRNNGYVVDNRLSDRFYTEFKLNIMTFINAIDWQLYDGVFKLNGTPLGAADLKGMFSKKNEKRTEIIFGILKQNDLESRG